MKKDIRKIIVIFISILLIGNVYGQDKSIQDLDFLIGEWKVKEENKLDYFRN